MIYKKLCSYRCDVLYRTNFRDTTVSLRPLTPANVNSMLPCLLPFLENVLLLLHAPLSRSREQTCYSPFSPCPAFHPSDAVVSTCSPFAHLQLSSAHFFSSVRIIFQLHAKPRAVKQTSPSRAPTNLTQPHSILTATQRKSNSLPK